jgi:hypothetical protein
MYTETFSQMKKQLGQLDKWLGTAIDMPKAKPFDPERTGVGWRPINSR